MNSKGMLLYEHNLRAAPIYSGVNSPFPEYNHVNKSDLLCDGFKFFDLGTGSKTQIAIGAITIEHDTFYCPY